MHGGPLVKWGAAIGFAAGAALAAWLLSSYGAAAIFGLLERAGWGLAPVVLFHLVQVAASAAAWRTVAGPTRPRPSLLAFMALRWIREAVNNLLPVAQIGGEFVAAGLLRRRGVPLAQAVAGSVGDLTVEMVTQIAFTLLGLGLLLALVGDGGVAHAVLAGIAGAVAVAVAFVAAQNLGLARLIERGLARLGTAIGWGGFGEVEGLHAAVTALYRAPLRLLAAAWWHGASWLLGGVEVCLALHALGQDVGIGPCLVIESLGQALKAAGFAVPGALGVQEGGLIVVCALFGLSPETAIALSLVKRLREVALGVPGLLAWQRMEAAPFAPQPSGAARP